MGERRRENRTHDGPDAHDPRDDGAEVDALGEVVDRVRVGHVEVREADLAPPDDDVVGHHATLASLCVSMQP